MPESRKLASLFVDFENVYYFIKNTISNEGADELSVTLLQKLRKYLLDTYDEHVITLDAYADFERIEDNVQGSLYLLGIETHNVLGTEHKNAADMKLCVDAMEILYTRAEIASFVVVAGDRDYIPVVRHLKKHGRTVRVAGFTGSVSGDLLLNVGQENFIDIGRFVARPAAAAKPHRSTMPESPANGGDDTLAVERAAALATVFKYFAGKPEVWLTPYLHKLRAELPHLAEWQRRQLLTTLEESGAMQVEKRQGDTHEYSVLVLNWNHPDVQAAAP